MSIARRRLASVVLAVLGVGCDFQPDPLPGPDPLPPARLVSVAVEYRQPNGCLNVSARCDDLVVFFGSWMRPGQEVYLQAAGGGLVWTGVVQGVPVNWPPSDEPHLVRVFDPHLVDSPTGGVTAARLIVGGQILSQFDSPGTPKESGLVYVDDNGVGRNPI